MYLYLNYKYKRLCQWNRVMSENEKVRGMIGRRARNCTKTKTICYTRLIIYRPMFPYIECPIELIAVIYRCRFYRLNVAIRDLNDILRLIRCNMSRVSLLFNDKCMQSDACIRVHGIARSNYREVEGYNDVFVFRKKLAMHGNWTATVIHRDRRWHTEQRHYAFKQNSGKIIDSQ